MASVPTISCCGRLRMCLGMCRRKCGLDTTKPNKLASPLATAPGHSSLTENLAPVVRPVGHGEGAPAPDRALAADRKQDSDTELTRARPTRKSTNRDPRPPPPALSAARLTRPIAVAVASAAHPASCYRSLLCLLHGFHQPVRPAPVCMKPRTWRSVGRHGTEHSAKVGERACILREHVHEHSGCRQCVKSEAGRWCPRWIRTGAHRSSRGLFRGARVGNSRWWVGAEWNESARSTCACALSMPRR